MRAVAIAILLLALCCESAPLFAQTANQSKPKDEMESSLAEMERQWAEVCATHDTSVLERILADDFVGTNTEGKQYTKSEDIEKIRRSAKKYKSGRLDEVRVRFYGSNIAVLHGVETCVRETNDGEEEPETAVWTDTWLERNGVWQIVAAQDAIYQTSTQSSSETQRATSAAVDRTSEVVFVPAKQLLSEIRKAPERRPSISWVDYVHTPPYTATVIRRTAPDRSEVHKDVTEVQYVIEGSGNLVTGGSLLEAVETESGELRGRDIIGGKERSVAPGDLIVIPAETPHWIRKIESKDIVYLSVKSTSGERGLPNDTATPTYTLPSANLPQPASEMQSLAKAFEGKWRIEEKYEPDEWTPNGGTGYGEQVWRRGPGGFTFMEEVHDHGPTGESFGLALMWWDKAKGFQGLWCENHNPQGCAIGRDVNGTGKWDGKQQVVDNEFQRNGKTFRWHEVFSDITPTSFVQTADIGEKGGPLKRWLTIHATRIATEVADHSQDIASNSKPNVSPSPEMQRLFSTQLGRWSEREERPDGSSSEGEAVWRPGPGGMSLLENEYIKSSTGNMVGLSVTWWDDSLKGYRALWCDNKIKDGCLVTSKPAHWEGDQFVLRDEFERDGKKLVYKEVESEITSSTYTVTAYTGEPDNLRRIYTTRATKITEVDADSARAAEVELRAVMAERRKASIEGDVETVASSMTDDYLQTDIYGYQQDKTAWLNEYFRPLADLIKAGKFHWKEFEQKNLQFRCYGDSAVVTGELQAKGTGAKPGPQHTWVADANATFGGTLHFTHVYVKRNGKWLLAALHNQLPLAPTQADR